MVGNQQVKVEEQRRGSERGGVQNLMEE